MATKAEESLNESLNGIVAFINAYRVSNGYGPTVRDIGDALDISSTGTVARLLGLLKSEGRVTWDIGRARTLRVVGRVGFEPT